MPGGAATAAREAVEARLDRVSAKPAERKANLEKLFQEAGCRGDRLSEQPVQGSRFPNLVCSIQGERSDIVVVGAHYDHAEISTGAVDNWSGAAMLPGLYAAIAASPTKYTFIFAGFAGEEKGRLGSRRFLEDMPKEDRARIRAFINLECLGLSSTKIWASRSDRRLNAILARVARSVKAEVSGVNLDAVGEDDTKSFLAFKIPVLTVHSVTQQSLHVPHSRYDTIDAIRRDDYYDTYRLLCAYLSSLDGALD